MDLQRLSRGLRLLSGSALGAVFATQSVQAASNAPVEEVVVQGAIQTTEVPALSKLTEPLLETPQSINIVSESELQLRGITNLNDALRDVPGISLGAGEFAWQGNTPTIRGFVARNDMFMDGMRDFGSYYRDSFHLQQIEVLQGPSSIYFGRGSTGGVIHQVSKQPGLTEAYSGGVNAGTDGTRRATLDANVPLSLAPGAAARIAMMGHKGSPAGRDIGEVSRYGVAPSLAFGLGTPTRLTATYFHQREDNVPDYGLPWYFGRPAPVPRESFYGFASDHLETGADIATWRAEHTLNGSVLLRNQIRYAHYSRDFRITEPVIAPGTTAATPLSAVQVARNIWSGDSTESMLAGQLDAIVHFTAGGIEHAVVGGIEASRESSKPTYENSTGVPTVGLLSPNPHLPFTGKTFPRLSADTIGRGFAAYIVDTVTLSEAWEISAGLRWDRFASNFRSVTYDPAGTIVARNRIATVDSAPSYRAAVTYKPSMNGSIYAAFGTSFNPSAESLSQVVAARNLSGLGNVGLDPEENRSFEVGSKWNLLDGGLSLTGSVFRLEKLNARVPDPNNPGLNMLGGQHRVDGAQIQAIGAVSEQWRITTSYAYLDSKVAKSAPGAAPVGRPLVNTPKHSFNAFVEYIITPDFEVGGGGRYVSERLGQNTGTTPLVADAFWSFDAMAKYRVSETITLQLNVYNIADDYYFEQLHPFHVVPGAGRSALLALNFRT